MLSFEQDITRKSEFHVPEDGGVGRRLVSRACASHGGGNAEKKAEFLDGRSFDLARLERQVKLDEETYLSYVRSAEESRLSTAFDRRDSSAERT